MDKQPTINQQKLPPKYTVAHFIIAIKLSFYLIMTVS